MATQAPVPPSGPLFNADEVSQLLQRFVDVGNRPVEATVDDLVRVRVGAAFNVLAVEILDPVLNPEMKRRLETAVVGAVNTALQRAALAAGQALRDFTEQTKVSKAADTPVVQARDGLLDSETE